MRPLHLGARPARRPFLKRPERPVGCIDCGGTGWRVRPDGGAGAASPCACRDLPRPMALAFGQVPELFRLAAPHPKAFDPGQVQGGPRPGQWPEDQRYPGFDLRGWRGEPATVSLHGTNGAGKSMLAAELLYRLYEAGRRPILWAAADDLVASHFGDGALLERARRVPALVIDELARGHAGEFAWSVLSRLVRKRTEVPSFATITTTNIRFNRPSPKALEALASQKQPEPPSIEQFDSALWDTLADGLVILIKAPSLRGQTDWRTS